MADVKQTMPAAAATTVGPVGIANKRKTEEHHELATTTGGMGAVLRGRQTGLIGGDLENCVNAEELDAFMSPLLGRRWLRACVLHDVAQGSTDAQSVADLINDSLMKQQNNGSGVKGDESKTVFVCTTIWTRHHWALAVFTTSTVYILDSAASPATARDFCRTIRKLGFAKPRVISIARQLRDSNECGIFTICCGLLLYFGGIPWLEQVVNDISPVSLTEWRALLPIMKHRGISETDALRLLDAVSNQPRMEHLINGAVSQADRLRCARTATSVLLSRSISEKRISNLDKPVDLFVEGGAKPGKEMKVKLRGDPLTSRAEQSDNSTEVIEDVSTEEAYMDVPWTYAELEAMMPEAAKFVGKWFDERIVSLNLERDGDLKKIEREWASLNRHSKLRRRFEFEKRRSLPAFGRNNATVCLRNAPEKLPDGLREKMITSGRKKTAKDVEKTLKMEHRVSFIESGKTGAFISSRVLEEILAMCPAPENWSILGPEAIIMYANTGRAVLPTIPGQYIAAVIHHRNHYTFLAIERNGGILKAQHADSLHPGKLPGGQTLEIIRRILFWADPNCKTATLTPIQCQLQSTNDCGLHAINNMGTMIFGMKGNLTRELICEAAKIATMEERQEKWKMVWPCVQHDTQYVNKNKTKTKPMLTKPVITVQQSDVKTVERSVRTSTPRTLRQEQKVKPDVICSHVHDPYAPLQFGPPRLIPAWTPSTSPIQVARNSTLQQTPVVLTSANVQISTPRKRVPPPARVVAGVRRPSPRIRTRTSQTADPIGQIIEHHENGAQITGKDELSIRDRLKGILINSNIEFEWDFGTEHGRWFGKLMRQPSYGLKAIVRVEAEYCRFCAAWHKWAVPEDFEFPATQVKYRSIILNTSELDSILPNCDHDEIGSDIGSEEAADETGIAEPAETSKIEERMNSLKMAAPLRGNVPQANELTDPLGAVATKWFIFGGKPPHVHMSTWKRLEKETHDTHIRWLRRIRHCTDEDSKLKGTPLATVLVETVMRFATRGRWAWSTISGALSACVAAVRALPIYTSATYGFDLRANVIIQETQKFAASQARIAAVGRLANPGLSEKQLQKLKDTIKCPKARCLLIISWALAARVGDVRRLQPKFVKIEDVSPEAAIKLGDVKKLTATFVEGKGAKFWGPFTLCTFIDSRDATVMRELITTCEAEHDHIWTKSDQEILAKAIKDLNGNRVTGLTLRSIRRGSLITLSRCGATERELMLLSGHKRRATLMIYLGLGTEFKEAERAAASRQEKVFAKQFEGNGDTALQEDLCNSNEDRLPETAETPNGGEPTDMPHKPMAVGMFSGFAGPHGRRRRPPPELFTQKPPSRVELGIDAEKDDTRSWPLHTKQTGTLNWEELIQMVQNDELKQELLLAREWTRDESLYGANWPDLSPMEIPAARFTRQQVDVLLAAGKIVPHRQEEPIRAGCRGFTIPEIDKRRLRPIFEPTLNAFINRSARPALRYPSRLERRRLIARKKFFKELDFAAFFDQIELEENVRKYFVIRVGDEIFDLTKIPMGATFSAHVAQLITWSILEKIVIEFPTIGVSTMLDNVGFAGDDKETFNRAIDTFLERCQRAGIVINGHPQIGDDHTTNVEETWTHLGEEFFGNQSGLVRNRDRNIQKLKDAYTRLQKNISTWSLKNSGPALPPPEGVTARQFVACLSLTIWLAHTINEPLYKLRDLLTIYSKIARVAANDFDTPMIIEGTDISRFGRCIGRILKNEWTEIIDFVETQFDNQDTYDAICIVDASKDGWASIVSLHEGQKFELQSGWSSPIRNSAWAEPCGATKAVEWLLEYGYIARGSRIAIVADHSPMITAQRCGRTGNGGFSAAYFLNKFFATIYENCDAEVFFVEGSKNPADHPSRSIRIGDPVRIRECNWNFSLNQFWHPQSDAQRMMHDGGLKRFQWRQWWQV